MVETFSFRKFWLLPKLTRTQMSLIGIVTLSVFLRILWLFTPVARDEGAVGYVAMVWSRGILPYGPPMAAVNPPLVYIFYLIPSAFFGNNIIPIRILNDVLFLISLIALYAIAKDWFSTKVGLISAAFYGVFMTAPIFEENLAIPSSLALPFAILSIYLFNVWLKNQKRIALFGAGFLMSMATLILQYYIVGIGVLLASTLIALYKDSIRAKKSFKFLAKKTFSAPLIVIAGFSILFLIVSSYFFYKGIFLDFFQDTVTRFVGSSSYVNQPDVYFSMKFLIVVEALPLWISSVAGAVYCFLRRTKYNIILLVWIAFMILIAIPPPHFGRHFSQLIPPLSILSGFAIASLLESVHIPSLHHFNNLKKNIFGIALLVTIIIAIVPAFEYQSIQYPNTNYTLFGLKWTYTFSNNWSQQQELVNYIKNNAENQPILIHGWEDELYWLTGHLAPGIQWASSYISQMPNITSQSYKDILQGVNNGTFLYAILMTGFPIDQIMNAVKERYFYAESIGPYAIYYKYNSEGFSTILSFAEDINQSYQEYWLQNGTAGNIENLNETAFKDSFYQLATPNYVEPAIQQIPPGIFDGQLTNSTIVFNNIFVPKNCELNFGAKVIPNSANESVCFEILIQYNNSTKPVFTRDITGSLNQTISLSQFSGKNVTFYFMTSATEPELSFWLNPVLLQQNEIQAIKGENRG